MARPNSWIDPSRRGFTGSSSTEESSKLHNEIFKYDLRTLDGHLTELMIMEKNIIDSWSKTIKTTEIDEGMLVLAKKYGILNEKGEHSFKKLYTDFITDIAKITPTPEKYSGNLGGFDDGAVTLRDLHSASEPEHSIKMSSYYSRASALAAEQIHSQLGEKIGSNFAGLRLKEGTARLENGQFMCQLISDDINVKPVEIKIDLHPESQQYEDKMLKSMETAVDKLEIHDSGGSHQVSEHMERVGTAVGTLGLMLGMKGAARAFEQGDVAQGTIATLQTLHGVTSMAMSAVGKQVPKALERKAAKAVVKFLDKSLAKKAFGAVIPVVGIGFGIYNIEEDLRRKDTLGYIDAVIDTEMVGLDIIEMAQPELMPIIAPINLALSVIRLIDDDIFIGIQTELDSLPKDTGVLNKIEAVAVGFGKGLLAFANDVGNFSYDSRDEELEQGRKLVERISDYHKYYEITQEAGGTNAIDFSRGDSSWNGGGIQFYLSDKGQSKFCMDYFVSNDESLSRRCWNIDTHGSKDIILGIGESQKLKYRTIQKKVFCFIPAGSVTVVSGYEALAKSRYGTYTANRESNQFFAVQKADDKHIIEVMLDYYYRLYGEAGDDTFFLGPQKNFVMGAGGKDTYVIHDNGGKTIIDNHDPSKSTDTLLFSVDYSQISVSKSGEDVVLRYLSSHTVTIQNWFLGEEYRHLNMMSGDGVLFDISSTVISSAHLVARGINKISQNEGQTVDASQPFLRSVTNILGSAYDDTLIGNRMKNLMDGGGGRDHLKGGEGEDIYMVKDRKRSTVYIENYSTDKATDVAIIEADLSAFKVRVEADDLILQPFTDGNSQVVLVKWFRSEADRHLAVVTGDLVTFTLSDDKADCRLPDPFTKCIRSQSIDYRTSRSSLNVDLERDEALQSVTEVRGSNHNDVIKGNKGHNTIIPGKGSDYLEGRGGEDWYVITPGQGIKYINNKSPDLAMDTLFLKEQYQYIHFKCKGQDMILSINGEVNVNLKHWFESKYFRHLQIVTTDGVTFELESCPSRCNDPLKIPKKVDFRNQETVRNMMMNNKDFDSVIEMYGSSGLDNMIGNSQDNLLDPYTGGGIMAGGEGRDTYIVKSGYGTNLIIDNFAEDESVDTVLVDMDFLSGSQITLSSVDNVILKINAGGDVTQLTLLNYLSCPKNQHLNFQSSDGVNFHLKSPTGKKNEPSQKPWIEAYKVTLKDKLSDCHLDLSSQRNLSSVKTVQGCSSQSNFIEGNDLDNALFGGWKDDALNGGEGNDNLMGGDGNDILIGGAGDDTLYGEDGDDTMEGNTGRDVFVPGPGADLVDGGPGRDTVLYRGDHEKGEGVYVNLLSGECRKADAEGDVLKDVENVIGTIYPDILVSGYEPALLKGSDGNDVLVSIDRGDYLIGGDGNDIYMMASHQGSVTIDNCAKDKATDVLYLSSMSNRSYSCKHLSDGYVLTFWGPKQMTAEIKLQGWVSEDHECGHLKLVLREGEESVDYLLTKCCQIG